MASRSEIAEKERRARRFLEDQGLGALVLSTQAGFAWMTCGGDNHVAVASEGGVASAVITPEGKYILCDNIEARRMMDEEAADQGFELRSFNWWENRRQEIVDGLAAGRPIGADAPFPGARMVGDLASRCRSVLTPEEVDRYRWVGANTGECISEACRAVRPGMTEYEIAGLLVGKIMSRGMIPHVTLVAVDDRISSYRHPIPTDKRLEKYAMLVICARRWGLIVSATRLVHIGKVSAELRRKHDAVANVDAVYIKNTRPGQPVAAIFGKAVEAYKSAGFGEEWKLHHQGGPTGYLARDYRADLSTADIVMPNQAFAWNPSITGTKSEDTIIAGQDATEVLSLSKDWPAITVRFDDGAKIARPDILEI